MAAVPYLSSLSVIEAKIQKIKVTYNEFPHKRPRMTVNRGGLFQKNG
jgi:hypothetical protein